MGISTSKPQSPEEIVAVRNARVSYNDYLSNTQTNTKTDISNNAITPETGNSIYTVIKNALEWLKNNPNSNINELLTNRDATTNEIKRLVTTDAPKRRFLNTLVALPIILSTAVNKNIIKHSKEKELLRTVKKQKSWYDKHSITASEIDFTREMQVINDSITNVLVKHDDIEYVKSQLNSAQQLATSQLNSEITNIQAAQQAKADQTVDLQSSTNLALSIASQVFWSLLLIVLCLLSGSFAANAAIGRVPAYRVFYFIYGALPIFAPFVIIYTIYRRIKYGRIPMYTMLPISIEPATTRLGKVLWSAFYWIPDQLQIDEYKAFTESLAKQVA